MIPPKRDRIREDVAAEMEHYLEERTAELVAAGMDPGQAREEAEAAFGDLDAIRDSCSSIQIRRHRRNTVAMALGNTLADLRVVCRGLARRKAFTAGAILTLALGIGANVGLFSVVSRVLLRPLPYPGAQELVQLWESDPERPVRTASPADFLDIRRDATTLLEVAAYHSQPATLGGGERPARIRQLSASSNLFRLLGVNASLGRTFTEGPAGGAAGEMVLSHGIWTRNYGADPGVVGRSVQLNQVPYTVVGVMPPGFSFPEETDVWTGTADDVPSSRFGPPGMAAVRDAWYLSVVARLAPGTSLDAAQAEMATLAQGLARLHPEANQGLGIRLVPLQDEVVGSARGVLLLLLAATGLVLLVACANVGNLLLVRALSRHREVAVRRALGAGRGRLLGHVLLESAVLALGGALAGWTLAAAGLAALGGGAGTLPGGLAAPVDGWALGYAGAVALGAMTLFGAVPAWVSSSVALQRALANGGGRTTGSSNVKRMGNVLVAMEVALALTLVLGATLTLRSVARLHAVDPGFDPENLTLASVSLPGGRGMDGEARALFYEAVAQGTAHLPGVTAAALTQYGPLRAGPGAGLRILNPPSPGTGHGDTSVRWQVVSHDYMEVLGVPVRWGRSFLPSDDQGGEPVALVNETLARQFFGEADPVGQLVSTGLDGRDGDGWRWVRIVGVVADTRNRGPAVPPEPVLFRPLRQGGPGFPGESLTVVARTAPGSQGLALALADLVAALNPDSPVFDVRDGHALGAAYTADRTRVLGLLGAFAALALVLGVVGVYAVTAQAVRRRLPDLGVRMALGADAARVLSLVVQQGLQPVLAGVAVGLAGSLGVSRLLQGYLVDAAALDPVAFAVAGLTLTLAGLLATLAPAWQASRVDPLEAIGRD